MMRVTAEPKSVYVADDGFGLCKVGVSGNIPQRTYHLRRDTGRPVEIVHVEPPVSRAELVEAAAHWTLAPSHVTGEWFRVTPEQAVIAIKGAQERIAAGDLPVKRFITAGSIALDPRHEGLGLSEVAVRRMEAVIYPCEGTRAFFRKAVEAEIRRRETIIRRQSEAEIRQAVDREIKRRSRKTGDAE